MSFLQKLVFNKETSRVYCVDVDGKYYAEFPVCFNYWGGYNSEGQERTAIPNGEYPIANHSDYDMEYGAYQGGAYGTFWVALDTERGRGFHGYGEGRSLTSGTYGCIRADNADGEQICRAIDRAIFNGVQVYAEVVGNVDERAEFCIGYDGKQ